MIYKFLVDTNLFNTFLDFLTDHFHTYQFPKRNYVRILLANFQKWRVNRKMGKF